MESFAHQFLYCWNFLLRIEIIFFFCKIPHILSFADCLTAGSLALFSSPWFPPLWELATEYCQIHTRCLCLVCWLSGDTCFHQSHKYVVAFLWYCQSQLMTRSFIQYQSKNGHLPCLPCSWYIFFDWIRMVVMNKNTVCWFWLTTSTYCSHKRVIQSLSSIMKYLIPFAPVKDPIKLLFAFYHHQEFIDLCLFATFWYLTCVMLKWFHVWPKIKFPSLILSLQDFIFLGFAGSFSFCFDDLIQALLTHFLSQIRSNHFHSGPWIPSMQIMLKRPVTTVKNYISSELVNDYIQC